MRRQPFNSLRWRIYVFNSVVNTKLPAKLSHRRSTTVYHNYSIETPFLTFKCQNDLAPQYLTSKFTKRSNIHTRNTRTRNSLQIPLYRTAIGQHTFSYRGANIWNNLHNELRQSASLASFKRALKGTLLRQTFPS